MYMYTMWDVVCMYVYKEVEFSQVNIIKIERTTNEADHEDHVMLMIVMMMMIIIISIIKQ